MPTYNEFAIWLSSAPGAVEALGWKKIDSRNPFLSQYELPAKIQVFDRETESIVFTASGPMALLDGVGAPDLAKELNVIAVISTPEKFLGEKVVVKSTEKTGRIDLLHEHYAQRLDRRVTPRQDAGWLLLYLRN